MVKCMTSTNPAWTELDQRMGMQFVANCFPCRLARYFVPGCRNIRGQVVISRNVQSIAWKISYFLPSISWVMSFGWSYSYWRFVDQEIEHLVKCHCSWFWVFERYYLLAGTSINWVRIISGNRTWESSRYTRCLLSIHGSQCWLSAETNYWHPMVCDRQVFLSTTTVSFGRVTLSIWLFMLQVWFTNQFEQLRPDCSISEIRGIFST